MSIILYINITDNLQRTSQLSKSQKDRDTHITSFERTLFSKYNSLNIKKVRVNIWKLMTHTKYNVYHLSLQISNSFIFFSKDNTFNGLNN